MEFELFAVSCKNKDCGYGFVTNSIEHKRCPSCDGKLIEYSPDSINATSNDIFIDDLEESMNTKRHALAGILVASSYASGDPIIARFDDYSGFNLNLHESEFTDKILKVLGLSSISELEVMINESMEVHPSLIYEPILDCIQRERFVDEDDCLYESGEVEPYIAKKFYYWILNNTSHIAEVISTCAF